MRTIRPSAFQRPCQKRSPALAAVVASLLGGSSVASRARLGLALLAASLLAAPLAPAATSSTLLAAGGTTTTTYQNISQGLALLSNSGKAVAYLAQVQGDPITYSPVGPQFNGIILVLDAGNNVVKTIDLRGGGYVSNASYFVNDMSVVALTNGGFAAAWSENTNDINSTVRGVRYDIFDNAGNLVGNASGSNALSATVGSGVKLAALSGGGFAAVFGTAAQVGIINTFTYSAGSYSKNTEATFLSNSTSVPGATADVGRLYTFGGGGNFSIAGLSSGGFVVTAPVYDYLGPTYTPLGVFIFGFTATGAKQNFTGTGASGQYWQRVNWNANQTSDPALIAAFTGGFATLNFNATKANWQATVFNNDGSLVTTTSQTASVYNSGSFSNKTYYAANLAAVSPSIANVATVITALAANPQALLGNPNYSNASDVAALLVNGSNVVAVLPGTTGGFDLATVSTTTGNLVGSVASAGFTIPSSSILTSPKFTLNAGSYNAIFDSQQYQYSSSAGGYYVLSGIYQVGLTVTATAPTATTGTATSVAATTATLNGTVNASGASTTATFDYGLTASYGSTATATQSPVTGSSNTAVSAALTGLTASTTYHFRVKGVSSGGTTNGSDVTFTTSAPPDTTAPTISSIVRQTPTAQSLAAGTTTATYRVTFSEPINTPATSNFAVLAVNSSSIVGTVSSVTAISTSIYDVAVTLSSGTGEFRLKVTD